MTEWIVQYWLEVLFTVIVSCVGWGYRHLTVKMKEGAEKQKAVEKGIQALLRDRIIQVYNHYIDKGFCPIYAMENVEALYKQYTALEGNGAVTALVEKLRELPTERE